MQGETHLKDPDIQTGQPSADDRAGATGRDDRAGAGLDAARLAALRAGDEQAFTDLVHALHPAMLRLARVHVDSDSLAEEVAQEAWLGVLTGLDRFEGRSTLRTWILRITANIAMTRGVREHRAVPLSSLLAAASAGDEAVVEPEQFLPAGDRWAGHWAVPPERWAPQAEAALLSGETADIIRDALDDLPPAQRIVMALRDIDGWDSAEVCAALEISAGNQRVLLHRARARVRTALDAYTRSVDEAGRNVRQPTETNRA